MPFLVSELLLPSSRDSYEAAEVLKCRVCLVLCAEYSLPIFAPSDDEGRTLPICASAFLICPNSCCKMEWFVCFLCTKTYATSKKLHRHGTSREHQQKLSNLQQVAIHSTGPLHSPMEMLHIGDNPDSLDDEGHFDYDTLDIYDHLSDISEPPASTCPAAAADAYTLPIRMSGLP
jgi:hypothetical protein